MKPEVSASPLEKQDLKKEQIQKTLTFRADVLTLFSNGTGMLVRRLASGNLGAFRFLRKNFQAISGPPPTWASAKFRVDNVIDLIGLLRIDDVSANRMRRQVSNLQACGIVLFVHKTNIQVRHTPNHIPSVGYSAKLQLQLDILNPAAPLNNNVSELVELVVFRQPSLQTLHAEV